MRTCAGCRTGRPKREMVRVVRAADGTVAVDPTGKRAGRGTYVCPRADCWQQAIRTGSLARVLKTDIGPTERAALQAYAAGIGPLEGDPSLSEALAHSPQPSGA